jgi:hypothetical protein
MNSLIFSSINSGSQPASAPFFIFVKLHIVSSMHSFAKMNPFRRNAFARNVRNVANPEAFNAPTANVAKPSKAARGIKRMSKSIKKVGK